MKKHITKCKVYNDGTKEWYYAYDNPDGYRIHHDNPNHPAVEYSNGDIEYWRIDGMNYCKKDYYKELYNRGLITKEECIINIL